MCPLRIRDTLCPSPGEGARLRHRQPQRKGCPGLRTLCLHMVETPGRALRRQVLRWRFHLETCRRPGPVPWEHPGVLARHRRETPRSVLPGSSDTSGHVHSSEALVRDLDGNGAGSCSEGPAGPQGYLAGWSSSWPATPVPSTRGRPPGLGATPPPTCPRPGGGSATSPPAGPRRGGSARPRCAGPLTERGGRFRATSALPTRPPPRRPATVRGVKKGGVRDLPRGPLGGRPFCCPLSSPCL